MKAFFYALGAPFRALFNPDGLRAWALMLMAGCSVAMTIYVSCVLWLVKSEPRLAFYLGIGGFLMIAIVTTGFAGLLVRRSIDLDALGVKLKITDQEIQTIADKVAANIPAPPAATPASVIVQTGSPPSA